MRVLLVKWYVLINDVKKSPARYYDLLPFSYCCGVEDGYFGGNQNECSY